MPKVSKAVFDFAKECFERSIEDLLDDPSDLLHPLRDEEPAEYFVRERRLAAELGLDFDGLVAKGTIYEQDRLCDIETGKIKPAPRQTESS